MTWFRGRDVARSVIGVMLSATVLAYLLLLRRDKAGVQSQARYIAHVHISVHRACDFLGSTSIGFDARVLSA